MNHVLTKTVRFYGGWPLSFGPRGGIGAWSGPNPAVGCGHTLQQDRHRRTGGGPSRAGRDPHGRNPESPAVKAGSGGAKGPRTGPMFPPRFRKTPLIIPLPLFLFFFFFL